MENVTTIIDVNPKSALYDCLVPDDVEKTLDSLEVDESCEKRTAYLYDFMGINPAYSFSFGNKTPQGEYSVAMQQLLLNNERRRTGKVS